MRQLKRRRKPWHPAEQYAVDVLLGKVIACEWVKLACKRHLFDRYGVDWKKQNEKSGEALQYGFYFSEDHAEHILEFFGLLKHSKGEWAREQFILEPWEQFILWVLFGWLNESGYRRFKTAYLEIPRKNGKTTMIAGIGLYLFAADEEPGAEVYTAAVKRDQALLSHSEATRMAKMSPSLRKRIGIVRNNLHIEKLASKFEPLGRDADSCDGLNVHGALVDELHAHKTRDMWDVLETATGARRQPLQLAITTAGFDRETICWEQHEYVQTILKNVGLPNGFRDDAYFGIIYTIDEGDDWFSEASWEKANPNFGISVKLDDLQRKALKAKEIPSATNNFLRKHLNVWVQQSTRWINIDLWNRNFKYSINENELWGRQCFGGLDLSSVSDITAWVMIFPDEGDFEQIDIISRFWCPESKLTDKSNRYRHLYESWHRDGWLNITSGDAIDYDEVRDQILLDAQHFKLHSMGIDRLFQGYQLGMELSKALNPSGSDKTERLTACGMGYQTMTPAMRELESRLLKEKINHGNNPIMRWMADSLSVKEDAAGGKKPDKATSQGKIDGIVALLIALDRAMRNVKKRSVYQERGLIAI